MFQVGDYVWLSSEHLRLLPSLSRKLTAKFVGPFRISQVINLVAVRLEVPDDWRIHNVFHVS